MTIRSRNGAMIEHVQLPKTAAEGIGTPLPKQGEIDQGSVRLGGADTLSGATRYSGPGVSGRREYSCGG